MIYVKGVLIGFAVFIGTTFLWMYALMGDAYQSASNVSANGRYDIVEIGLQTSIRPVIGFALLAVLVACLWVLKRIPARN